MISIKLLKQVFESAKTFEVILTSATGGAKIGSINRTEVTDLHMKAFGQNASLTSCKVEPQVSLDEAGEEEASEIPENFQTEDDEQSEPPEPVSTSNAQVWTLMQLVFVKKILTDLPGWQINNPSFGRILF